MDYSRPHTLNPGKLAAQWRGLMLMVMAFMRQILDAEGRPDRETFAQVALLEAYICAARQVLTEQLLNAPQHPDLDEHDAEDRQFLQYVFAVLVMVSLILSLLKRPLQDAVSKLRSAWRALLELRLHAQRLPRQFDTPAFLDSG